MFVVCLFAVRLFAVVLAMMSLQAGISEVLGATPSLASVAVKPGLEGAALDRQVAALMRRMSFEEKVLQLLAYPPNGVPRLGIPNLRWGETLHGIVGDGATTFPQAIAIGSTWDTALTEALGNLAAGEARALGIHQGYDPMLGLARDPRWGRVEESYGEDPYLVSRLGVAYINGLQGVGAQRFDSNHIFATPKHFVADGEPWAGANGEDFETSERTLREFFMRPFEAAIKEAHAESLMPAHHAINGIPCHANPWLLDRVLREEWGFTGFVVSDMGDIPKNFDGHHYADSMQEAAVMSLHAGVDMELEGGPIGEHLYAKYFADALQAGKISMADIDRAVRRVLGPKIQLLGLATPSAVNPASRENDAVLEYQGRDDIFAKLVAEGKATTHAGEQRADYRQVLNDPAHDLLALRAAQEAIVLLKNDGGLLPLKRAVLQRILVVGPLAERTNLGGYSTGKPKFYVNAVDGIKAEAGEGVTVDFSAGSTVVGGTREQLDAAVAAAQQADVIIAVVGHSRNEVGENHDRDSLDLPGNQEELVEAMQATGKPLVVVLNNGAPFALPWIHDHVAAVIESWYLGQSYGTALAQLLFGEVNPSGKLNVSFPVSIGQSPSYYDHPVLTGPILYDPARKDLPVPFGIPGVLWVFGHGLSYTSYAYSNLKISGSVIGARGRAQVSAVITNTGKRAGDEIVQLYLHQDHTSRKRPVQELKGFRRIHLEAGERRVVTFPVSFEEIKFWKDDRWTMEPGQLQVGIGAASDDIRLRGQLTLMHSHEAHATSPLSRASDAATGHR